MKKIGVITAMKEEYNSVKELMINIKEEKHYNLNIISRIN